MGNKRTENKPPWEPGDKWLQQPQEGLDHVLWSLQGQVIRRSVALIGDRRPEVRTVLENNLRIAEDLGRNAKHAARSRRVVDYLMPGKSS